MRIQIIALLVLAAVSVFALPTVQKAYGQSCLALFNYSINYVPKPYPGGTTTIVSDFTNTGSDTIRITSVTINSDLGTFAPQSGLPLVATPSQKAELNFSAQIPSSASVGEHPLTGSIGFQCQDQSSQQWLTPSSSPASVSGGSLTVVQNPSTTALIGLVIIGVIAALAVAVVVLMVKLRGRRRAESVPPAPPSMPAPPAQTPPTP